MVIKEELIEFGKENLSLILKRQGEIIYSSHETIKKGDIYLLGLNPGGEGSNDIENYTIEYSLNNLLTRTNNAYLEEKWDRQYKGKTLIYESGKAPLQQRVKFLIKSLGFKTEEVCGSNLIFVQSKSSENLNYGLAGYCWKFHEKILDIIQPKIILCFGISQVSSYSFLRDLYQGEEQKPFPSGHGKWECRAFHTSINGRRTTIVAIPHLSYYSINGKDDVVNWIKKFLN